MEFALSCLTLWVTVVLQGPLSMGFSRQEYWNEWPFPSPGELPDPGIEPRSPASQANFFYHLSHQGTVVKALWAFRVSLFHMLNED